MRGKKSTERPDEFAMATARTAMLRETMPYAVAARYNQDSDRIVLGLTGNVEIIFSPADVSGLDKAAPKDLEAIEISPSGFGLHFPRIDADIHVPALLDDLLGWSDWAAASLGRRGGRSRSPDKTAASRRNGRRGGRPRKTGSKT